MLIRGLKHDKHCRVGINPNYNSSQVFNQNRYARVTAELHLRAEIPHKSMAKFYNDASLPGNDGVTCFTAELKQMRMQKMI